MKKRKDPIMDSPLRTPTGAGYGSGGEGTTDEVIERKGYESNEDTSNRLQGRMVFRCRDVGDTHCDWQTSGKDEQELMPRIEEHGRKQHHLNMDDSMRERIRNHIKRAA